jgi:lysophospholipase L1-like esterase
VLVRLLESLFKRLAFTALLLSVPVQAESPQPVPPGIGMMDQPCPDQTGLWALSTYNKQYDWAWMCRYREDNRQYSMSNPAKVVFLGDSITEGWEKKDPTFFKGGIVDRGLGGQTSPQLLLRFYQDVIALHPAIVHIMVGTNDIAGNTGPNNAGAYRNNIRAMVDLAKANNIKVILGSIPPANTFRWRPDLKPSPTILLLNGWLKEFAKEQDLIFADYHSAMVGSAGEMRPEFTKDGVHPEVEGYQLMRPIAERAISEAVKKRSQKRR